MQYLNASSCAQDGDKETLTCEKIISCIAEALTSTFSPDGESDDSQLTETMMVSACTCLQFLGQIHSLLLLPALQDEEDEGTTLSEFELGGDPTTASSAGQGQGHGHGHGHSHGQVEGQGQGQGPEPVSFPPSSFLCSPSRLNPVKDGAPMSHYLSNTTIDTTLSKKSTADEIAATKELYKRIM